MQKIRWKNVFIIVGLFMSGVLVGMWMVSNKLYNLHGIKVKLW